MILPSSSAPPTNGTSPFNWTAEQLGSIDRMMLNAGVATAYKAVYGNCTTPSSYSAAGVNLMADIANAPSPSDVIASSAQASSLLSANPGGDNVPWTGGAWSGGKSRRRGRNPFNQGQPSPKGIFTDAPVNTSPLDGSQGYPVSTPIPPQTTSQGLISPVIPGAAMALRRPQGTCPVNAQPQPTNLSLPPAGQAPNWGRAFQTVPGPSAPAGSAFDLFGWMKANPWAALLIAAGGVAIFSSGGTR